jgi:molybdopterin biosynthesis enzyme MoaB
MVRIPGTGHSSSLETPEAVSAAIQELLRGFGKTAADESAVEKRTMQKNPR